MGNGCEKTITIGVYLTSSYVLTKCFSSLCRRDAVCSRFAVACPESLKEETGSVSHVLPIFSTMSRMFQRATWFLSIPNFLYLMPLRDRWNESLPFEVMTAGSLKKREKAREAPTCCPLLLSSTNEHGSKMFNTWTQWVISAPFGCVLRFWCWKLPNADPRIPVSRQYGSYSFQNKKMRGFFPAWVASLRSAAGRNALDTRLAWPVLSCAGKDVVKLSIILS